LSESKYIDVVVGKHGVTDDTWENFNVVKELVHPDYNTVNTRFDVMLLKSDQLMQDTQPVRINLDESIPVNGESLTVIGLGYTEEWRLPSSLHETTVTYTRNLDCVNMSDSQGQTLKNDLQLDMLCAGDPGRDSCYGDSGSPLIRPGGSTDTDIVVGIVSWGYECG
jgi:secreted trypsin-like serine protease